MLTQTRFNFRKRIALITFIICNSLEIHVHKIIIIVY